MHRMSGLLPCAVGRGGDPTPIVSESARGRPGCPAVGREPNAAGASRRGQLQTIGGGSDSTPMQNIRAERTHIGPSRPTKRIHPESRHGHRRIAGRQHARRADVLIIGSQAVLEICGGDGSVRIDRAIECGVRDRDTGRGLCGHARLALGAQRESKQAKAVQQGDGGPRLSHKVTEQIL